MTRIIRFGNQDWQVRSGSGGPGPNHWSDSNANVWLDDAGMLHLAIRRSGEQWQCSEVTALLPASYGTFRFYLIGSLDRLDPNVVFSPFLYRDDTHELDIEFSRWGLQSGHTPNAQYVVQPGGVPGHHEQFKFALNGTYTTHSIAWRPGEVTFLSAHGHYAQLPSPSYLIHQWRYVGADVPVTGVGLRAHFNLWLARGAAPLSQQETEVVIARVDTPSRLAWHCLTTPANSMTHGQTG